MEPSTQPGRASRAAAVGAPPIALSAGAPADPALHAAAVGMPASDGLPSNSSRTHRASLPSAKAAGFPAAS